MLRQIAYLLASLPLYILYLVLRSYYKAWQYNRKAAARGCKPAVLRPYKYSGGIDMIQMAFAFDTKHQLPNMFEQIVFQHMSGKTTFRQYFFGDLSILTIDPRNIQAILAHQFDQFELGALRRSNFFPLLGNGIFTADGKDWSHGRALLRPQFARAQVADLELEEDHVQDIFKHLKTTPTGWTDSVNLQPIFFRFTIDSATEFLFGESVQAQISALPAESPDRQNLTSSTGLDLVEVSKAFDRALHALGKRARFAENYWVYNPKSFQRDCALVHKFADFFVERVLSNDPEKATESPRYVFLDELAKSTRDPIELRSQLLNIFLAGRDTTAGLLSWIFWILARHPDIFTKLRTTILDDFGTYESPRNISFSSLKSCTYLQHVINETLRLYPSVPINSRRANCDTTIPYGGGPDGQSPVFVPEGTQVDYIVHVMHRSPQLWGPDANVFNPDRWTGRKVGWEFLPFNGGPRICLGQQLALTETGYVVVRMLQKFDALENLDPGDMEGGDEKYFYTVTAAPWEVNLRLREAK